MTLIPALPAPPRVPVPVRRPDPEQRRGFAFRSANRVASTASRRPTADQFRRHLRLAWNAGGLALRGRCVARSAAGQPDRPRDSDSVTLWLDLAVTAHSTEPAATAWFHLPAAGSRKRAAVSAIESTARRTPRSPAPSVPRWVNDQGRLPAGSVPAPPRRQTASIGDTRRWALLSCATWNTASKRSASGRIPVRRRPVAIGHAGVGEEG